jgi:hypothetical protein
MRRDLEEVIVVIEVVIHAFKKNSLVCGLQIIERQNRIVLSLRFRKQFKKRKHFIDLSHSTMIP